MNLLAKCIVFTQNVDGTYRIQTQDDFSYYNMDELVDHVPSEIISAAIYQLLESLKDHTPAGHEKATGE
jgi:hypothetical protein